MGNYRNRLKINGILLVTSNIRSLMPVTNSTWTKELQEEQSYFQKKRKQVDWAERCPGSEQNLY